MMDNILSLHHDLKAKTYIHGGYKAFNISDPKPRNIHKATVRDRLLHHAIYRILYSYFDKKFIYDSYSCRLNKGTHRAINRLRDFYYQVSKNNTRTCYVLKCDIRKFFANIDHEILKEILGKYIKDKNILWLLGQVIDSFSSQKYIYAIADMCKMGLPLGNLTSQLLVNIYMNEFDQFIKHKIKARYYVRYADDFVVLHENKKYLEELLIKIFNFLNEGLKLSLHPNKISIKTYSSGIDFLGWVNFPTHRVLRTTTKRRIFKKLDSNPSRQSFISYLGMLSHGHAYKLSQKVREKMSKEE